ncbi:hypothetical protein Tco_0942726 [Tanacetum coccineum]
MTTLAEHIIVAGAENCPPMLEKSMYDSWASRKRLFIKGKKYGRMMLDLIDNGPLKVQVNTKFLNALSSKWSKFVTDVKLAKSLYTTNYDQSYAYLSQHELHAQEVHIMRERYPDSLALHGKDLIDCINKAMAFLSGMASRFLPLNNRLRTSSNPRNQATIQDGRVIVQQIQGRQTQKEDIVAQQTIPQNSTFQTEDLDAYDSDCDDLSSAKAVLMENLSSYDYDVLSQVPYSDTYPNEMLNQDVQEMTYSKQTHTVDFPDNEINSDINIIPYSQYLQESQDAAMHMLTKPQVVYDDTHKQALGYQNPFNLKKAHRIKPTLYDGRVIAKEHVVIFVIDDEEILILEEESQSKMLDKQNNLILIDKKINISLIDYSKEAFWLKHSNYNPDTSVKSHTPVKIEAPSELPKSVENLNLNAQLQEKVFAIATLKNELRKLKGKNVVDTAVSKPNATIAPGMFKRDIELISHRLKNNRMP